MTTKPRRHKTVEMICKYCGTVFQSLSYRVEEGRGEFCSRSCSSKYQKECVERKYTGKENGKMAFNNQRQEYYVYWFEPETKKRRSTTYARWWLEMNVGEIPAGCRASYRDGNSLNIDPSNIYIKSKEEFGETLRKVFTGRRFSSESRRKMSESKMGKHLSDDHKNKIGMSVHKRWESGEFDSVHVGKNHRLWRGGTRPYPTEFNDKVRAFIRDRDNNQCQVCGKSVYKSRYGHVHHIDGNRFHNDDQNLILLCSKCHSLIHLSDNVDNEAIMYLKSFLKS